ncbi:MAG: type II methionyl aminopeptidase [Candidatus Nanoarchaeia archaeon]|nr:type II methionyl aminopeptidase [Candidatus Nanoarchaeia archaeon]MDD5239299.1 type II methionyl aminopeptidase [Candidatus Nanoarchaeia archaeon]
MEEELIEKYKKCGKIASEAREFSRTLIKEGAKTLDIANAIEEKMMSLGATGFAFPTNLSINSVAAHSTPRINDDTVLKKGDILKVDLGCHVDGILSDTAYTVEVGGHDNKDLVDASHEALKAALDIVKPGVIVSKIGAVIEDAIKQKGFKPIANLSGHEIGEYELHAGITIPNFDNKSSVALEEGMVVAIEPFATNGFGKVIDTKESEIFRLTGEERPTRQASARKIMQFAAESYQFLPFCRRWIAKKVGGFGIEIGMMELLRNGMLHQYPVLKEEKNGMVSQHEHTVIVLDKPIVTTL